MINKSLIIGTVLGAVGVTAGSAIAGYNFIQKDQQAQNEQQALETQKALQPQFAEVLQVQPIKDVIKTPRQVCHDVTVTHQQPVKDQNKVTGSILGAVVGGVLGRQVGGGNGKKAATVAGAVAGGFAGNKIQQNMQTKDTYTTTETRCNTVTDTQEKVSGYNVQYKLGEQVSNIRLNYDPGTKIPVQNGQLVLNATM